MARASALYREAALGSWLPSTATCDCAGSLNETMISRDGDRIIEKVQILGDLELALLTCLVADQHCIIQTQEEDIENVQEELKLVSAAKDMSEHPSKALRLL